MRETRARPIHVYRSVQWFLVRHQLAPTSVSLSTVIEKSKSVRTIYFLARHKLCMLPRYMFSNQAVINRWKVDELKKYWTKRKSLRVRELLWAHRPQVEETNYSKKDRRRDRKITTSHQWNIFSLHFFWRWTVYEREREWWIPIV